MTADADRRSLGHEPFRWFFLLGGSIGMVGVGHWLAYGLGWRDGYSGQSHALTQTQGFLGAFAAGFLLTMLPKRTRTAPPSSALVATLLLTLAAGSLGATFESWLVAESAHALFLGLLLCDVVSRLRRSQGPPLPPAFALLPWGIGWSLLGALLVAFGPTTSLGRSAIGAGRRLIQEAGWLGLVFGLAPFLLPVLAGKRESDPLLGSRFGRTAMHLFGLALGISVFAQQLVMDVVSPARGARLGLALRALIAFCILLSVPAARRWPSLPGTQRKFAWLAFWLLPLGLALAAALPNFRVALLHVFHVGGLSLLVLMVAAHVTRGHCAGPEQRDSPSWLLRISGFAILAAAATRVSADFLPDTYFLHLSAASGIWLGALGCWLVLILRAAFGKATATES
jgi:uncharacterized protein involved in response to NO